MSWKNTILAMVSFSTSSHALPVHLHKSKFTVLAKTSKQENGRDWGRENLGHGVEHKEQGWLGSVKEQVDRWESGKE
nr:hypothetical protein CFP56_24866 [Quercus suber]